MFIYAVRARTVKFFGLVILVCALVLGVVIFGGEASVSASASGGEIDFSGIKTNEDRVKFIESFGLKVDPEPLEEDAFAMPENFDRVILGYNELQKKQGLDLSKYAKKRVTRYTYKVTNYDCEGEVMANLFVWRGKIVACDVSSLDPEGFVLPLTLVDRASLK